jgi:hypothetical protein
VAGAGGSVQQVAPPKKGSRKMLWVMLILVGGLIAVIGTAISNSGGVSSPQVGGKECSDNSTIYLEMLKRGDADAPRYWKSGVRPVTLFSVHDYKRILQGDSVQTNGKPYPLARVYYRYEVESSTERGTPIRKRWDIVLEPSTANLNGTPCAIVALNEAK